MKNTTILVLIVLILVVGSIFVFSNSANSVNGDVIKDNSKTITGEVQKIVISEKNSNYYPNEIKVKAGQPVSISLDSKVTGCLRSFTIRDLGLQKYLRTPQDTLDFTPTKKGAFTFSCSMGMSFGKLIVE